MYRGQNPTERCSVLNTDYCGGTKLNKITYGITYCTAKDMHSKQNS